MCKTSKLALTLLAASLLAACAKPTTPPGFVAASSGTATVLSVDSGAWEATIQTESGPRLAYWTQDTFFFRGRTQLKDYAPPKGATFTYKGIITGRDLFLTHVWITKE